MADGVELLDLGVDLVGGDSALASAWLSASWVATSSSSSSARACLASCERGVQREELSGEPGVDRVDGFFELGYGLGKVCHVFLQRLESGDLLFVQADEMEVDLTIRELAER